MTTDPWILGRQSLLAAALLGCMDSHCMESHGTMSKQAQTTVTLASPAEVNDQFHQMTTRIVVLAGSGRSRGSGFFYQTLGPKKEDGHRMVEELWVVTNRHVLLPKDGNGNETRPSQMAFFLRGTDPSSNQVSWVEVQYRKDEMEERLRFHPDTTVDVALIGIDVQFIAAFIDMGSPDHPYTLDAPCFLDVDRHIEHQDVIKPAVGDDVLVVGYPRGFYDNVNLFPVVKAGVIASKWGAHFRGSPQFLIDAKLFPGSSGSVVVSKPVDMAIKDGRMLTSPTGKTFLLLGVFSAGYDLELGVVWYASNIEEVRARGVGLTQALGQ